MKLNSYQKNWIIGGAAFLLCAGASMAMGFGVASVTKSPEKPVTDAETLPEETDPSSEILPEDPGSDTVAITGLSSDEQDALTASFDAAPKTYYASENKNAQGRPVSSVQFADTAKASFGDRVQVFMPGEKEIGLYFILTEEYNGNTTAMLEKLREKEVKATFFMNMDFAINNPSVVTAIIEDGHKIGSLGSATYEDGICSLSAEEQSVNAMALQTYLSMNYQYQMQDFCFYNDKYSELSLAILTKMGYHVVFYSVHYDDGTPGAGPDANTFLQAMEGSVHDGAVYCFHTCTDADLMVVPALITSLKDQGYNVGPVR